MTIEVIGWAAALLFSACALPQAYYCHKVGNADGLHHGFLGMWFGGEILMIIYVFAKHGWDLPLLMNYVFNVILLLVIVRYKYWPKSLDNKCNDEC